MMMEMAWRQRGDRGPLWQHGADDCRCRRKLACHRRVACARRTHRSHRPWRERLRAAVSDMRERLQRENRSEPPQLAALAARLR